MTAVATPMTTIIQTITVRWRFCRSITEFPSTDYKRLLLSLELVARDEMNVKSGSGGSVSLLKTQNTSNPYDVHHHYRGCQYPQS